MPVIPTYQVQDFNVRPPPEARIPQPIDYSGIMEFGSNLIQNAQRQEAQDSAQQGYKDQQADKSGQLQQKPIGFFGGISDRAYNEGARQAFGMNKERELRQTMTGLDRQYQTDPDGYQKALKDAQVKFFRNVPVQIQPELQDMWNRSADRVQANIQDRLITMNRQQQAVDIGKGISDNLISIQNQALQDGHTADVDTELARIQLQTAQAVHSRIMTPAQALEIQTNAAVSIAKANYISLVNKGFDVNALTQQVMDPNNKELNKLTIDQRQSIIAEMHQQRALNLQASAADRTVFENRWNAQLKLAEQGMGQPIIETTTRDMMGKLGYEPATIDLNIKKMQQAQQVGNVVNLLKAAPLHAGVAMVQDARDKAQNYRGNDPVEQELLQETYLSLAQAQSTKVQAFQSDPWAATQAYAPKTYERYDLSTDEGLNAARADVVSKTGNANSLILPQVMLDGYKNTLDGAPDAATQVNTLADIRNRYPRNFTKIADALKLTPGQRQAAELINQNQSQAAQTILLAEHNSKALETYAKREDVNTAFDTAFPDKTVFANPDQAGQMKANFANVYRYYLGQGLNDSSATQKALTTLTAGQKQVRINGEQMLVPQDVDPKAVNKTLDDIAASPTGNNLVLGPQGQQYLNSEMSAALADPTRTRLVPQNGGFAVQDLTTGKAYYQQTPTGSQLLIVERDGSIRGANRNYARNTANHTQPGAWDGAVRVQPGAKATAPVSDSAASRSWQGGVQTDPQTLNVKVPTPAGKGVGFKPGTEPENPQDTALRANVMARKEGLVSDPFAARVTRNKQDQNILNGVSAVIRQGQTPEWALQALGDSGVKEFYTLKSQTVRDAVTKAFADPAQRGQTIGGIQESPLQTIERLTRTVGMDAIKTHMGYAPTGATSNAQAIIGPQPVPQFDKYAELIGKRERSNNYSAENAGGYLGRYQMGAKALADAGLIDPSAFKGNRTQKEILNDPNAWTIPGGKQGFLKDKALQDRVFRQFTYRNFLSLKSHGLINSGTSPRDIGGYLAVSHLLGVGGALDYAQGIDGADGNGTAARQYFALGQGMDTGDNN